MDVIQRLHFLTKLKEVYRVIPVADRFESTAEHSWNCILLADYFLANLEGIDRLRVFDLLLYHDLVEIESGDVYFLDQNLKAKKQKEKEAVSTLAEKIPSSLKERYLALQEEYESASTIESRFAKAIDKLEPVIHLLHAKAHIHKLELTEERIDSMKKDALKEFPPLYEVYVQIKAYWRDNGFFDW